MPINLGRKTFSTICVMLMVSMIFQNVAAEYYICTIEDNNQNITLNSEDILIISLEESLQSRWEYTSSNSSVLRLTNEDGYAITPDAPGSPVIWNWTFEGAEKGMTTLKFIKRLNNNSIVDTFFLNVTSNVSRTTSMMLIIIVFSVIIVVPSVIIIKWMKGGKNNEN